MLYVDSAYVYYESAGVSRYRERKTDSSGSGSEVATGGTLAHFSVVGGTLYWNQFNTAVFHCDPANCTGAQANSVSGQVVFNASTGTQSVAVVNFSCQYSSSFCIDWLDANYSSSAEYDDLYQPPTGGRTDSASFTATGSLVYGIASDYNAASAFVKGSLFSVNSAGLARAQLAGGLTEGSRIVDVNASSVLIADTADNIYRVPLPLGLGSQPPQSIGVTGAAATEDAGKLYWIDTQGTLYSCTLSSCASTTTVRANGQVLSDRILQDSTALYWGRANPPEVMRLAK
jgi:hypothetical protein